MGHGSPLICLGRHTTRLLWAPMEDDDPDRPGAKPDHRNKTDARKVKRCESILEEAISELIVTACFDAQWRQVDANFGAFRLARRGSFSFR